MSVIAYVVIDKHTHVQPETICTAKLAQRTQDTTQSAHGSMLNTQARSQADSPGARH